MRLNFSPYGYLAAVAAVIAVAGCNSPSGGAASSAVAGPHLITPAEAVAVVRAEQANNDKANAKFDTALQDKNETVPQSLIDDASYTQSKAIHETSSAMPTQLGTISVFVPHQSTYPAQFLAFVDNWNQVSAPGTDALLFVKASSADSWKVAMWTSMEDNMPLPTIATDASGYAVSVQDGAQIAALSQQYAQMVTTGIAAKSYANLGGFTTGPWTAGQIKGGYESEAQSVKSNPGYSATSAYAGGQYPSTAIAFQLISGGVFELFAASETDTLHAVSASPFQSTGTLESLPLAPGTYPTLAFHHIYLFAAVVPAQGHGATSIVGGPSTSDLQQLVSVSGS